MKFILKGGPFTCSVFDPNGISVSGLEGALPLVPHTVDLDCRGVGVPGEVFADIVHDKKSVHCRLEKVDSQGFHYRIHFVPKDAGKHRVNSKTFIKTKKLSHTLCRFTFILMDTTLKDRHL